MNWLLFALQACGLLFTAGQAWFLAEAWSFAVRTHTAWLIVLLATASTIVVSAQTYLCAVALSICHDTRKPEGVTPVNRQAFASFPYDSAAYLIRRKGTADKPAVGWEVGPSLPYDALSIDAGETPEPTPPLDTPAPAPFDSHRGIRDEGNVKETGRATEEEIGKVPSGAYGGKGNGLSRSSYSSPPTKASVETRKSARIEAPPDTKQSGRGADEDAVAKAIERGIPTQFDLFRSPAVQEIYQEEKIESDAAALAGAVSPKAGEGKRSYTYCWGSSGILPVRQTAIDISEKHSCQEEGLGESEGTRDRDQSHNAVFNHSGAAAGFQAGLDVVHVSELSDVCAICLGKYSAGERVHVLPCLHIFHEQCLDLWIASHPSCPYCKGDLNIFPPECEVTARRDNTRRFVSRMLFIFNCPTNWLRIRQQLRRRDQGGEAGDGEAFSRNIFV